ncbi:MAG TPA: hypothetical protein VOA78_09735 [Candidatus Dormibacteraeota bacterium]|nr:hypothetical protein [Candidatus Dormibacteraeota bacterium]
MIRELRKQNFTCDGLSGFPGGPAAFSEPPACPAIVNARRKLARLATLLLVALSSGHTAAQAPLGGTWERLGPDGGEVVSIAAAADGTLYLGTPDGHVFASADGARHWELRGRVGSQLEARPDGRIDGRIDGVVQRLLVDSLAPQRLFAAIWFQDPAAGGGVYRSEDGGRTWSLASLRGEAVRALVQSLSQPEILVAGSRSGVFRSSDAGRTWERISPAGDAELRNLDSLAIDPRDPQVLYAGTYHLPWKTTDGGKTWAPIAAGMIDDSDIMSLRVDATNPARLYASACSGIYRSENAGLQWTKLQGVPYAARRTQSLVQDPADPRVLYAGTTEGLWITRDAGESWARTTPREWAINGVAVLPRDSVHPARVVMGTEAQGVQASDDAGVHFAAANSGFSHGVVAAFAANPAQPGRWLASFVLPGAALLETRDAGQTWQPLADSAALTAWQFFNTQFFGTPAGWFAAPAEGGLLRYDDTKQAWRPLRFLPGVPAPPRSRKAAPPKRGARPVPREEKILVRGLQVENSRLFAVTRQGLWSGDIAAAVLRPLNSGALLQEPLGFAFDPAVPAASAWWLLTGASLLHSSDAGKSWQPEALPADPGVFRWMRFLPASGPASEQARPSGLLLGATHGVFWRPIGALEWRRLGAGLPSAETLPPSALEPASWLLAGKAGGLYLSRDAGATWTRLDGPQETSHFVGAAADGRGGVIAGSRSEGILRWKPEK